MVITNFRLTTLWGGRSLNGAILERANDGTIAIQKAGIWMRLCFLSKPYIRYFELAAEAYRFTWVRALTA